MIQANELRIGNLITVNNVIQEVCDLPLPENCTDENTKPIPLTEEWLLKFGFEYSPDDENSWYNLKYRNFNFASDYSVDFKQVFVYLNKTDIICDYVHQLQNLYFALTNKELEIQK